MSLPFLYLVAILAYASGFSGHMLGMRRSYRGNIAMMADKWPGKSFNPLLA